jgi:hypothetical protein
MNRYIFIRRLRGPAFLLLIGIIGLLDHAHILRWGFAWPLFLILWGVLLLAERAALAQDEMQGPPYPDAYPGSYPGQYPGQYPGGPYPGAPQPPASGPAASSASETSIVPRHGDEITHRGTNGGGQQ